MGKNDQDHNRITLRHPPSTYLHFALNHRAVEIGKTAKMPGLREIMPAAHR
ncbi:MAG: hypothetical protein Q7V05_01625 [Methanoregula sp.]|nr:hypothetical protein [Methanoregula sp.]